MGPSSSLDESWNGAHIERPGKMDICGGDADFGLGEGILESLITDHIDGRLQSLTDYKQSVALLDADNAPVSWLEF